MDSGTHGAKIYAIETRGLNLWYGDFQALYDVDLGVKRGIITSMIGPSGCGKTTLAQDVQPHHRTARVRAHDGERVACWATTSSATTSSSCRFAKQVGMVFQRPNPLPISDP